MAGSKRRKLRLSSKTSKDDKKGKKNKPEYHELWSVLPVELLQLIFSRLTLKDNIRTSSVCKKWLSVAISVRKFNKPPCLVHLPRRGHLFEFYDPTQRKTYSVDLPELRGCNVFHSKNGWLLVYNSSEQRYLFFSLFTRETIKLLPRFDTNCFVAFSTTPKSPDCIVITIKNVGPNIVAISTCRPGATEWTTVNYHNPFPSSFWTQFVYINGLFYCLCIRGVLGIYNVVEQTWSICIANPPPCPKEYLVGSAKRTFMVEHKGDIFVICTCITKNPLIYKLDLGKKEWVETNNLEGVSIFASFLSSHAIDDLPGMIRNRVYFINVRGIGKRCISYSLDERRYYPRNQFPDLGENWFENIWVEAPEDLSMFQPLTGKASRAGASVDKKNNNLVD